MDNKKEVKISFWASHLTTIVSVTLVLLLLGIISAVWISADRETRRLREKVEISAVMADSISDSSAALVAKAVSRQPFARNVRVVTRDEALKNWTADTGEDLQALYGVNPLSPEVVFSINAEWSSPGNIAVIRKKLEAVPGVESVDAPDAVMVESMNSNIAGLTLILGVIAAVMIVISFVLINNTVQLTIYSRRFSIHTMQLVGATDGFIRRPVVRSNALSGFIAGIIASALMAGACLGAPHAGFKDVSSYFSWSAYGCVAVGMTIIGTVMCALAAWIATARYLRKDYDELFR